MTGRHSGLGWPGAIGDRARDATAPPYIGRHRAGDAISDWMAETGIDPITGMSEADRLYHMRHDPRRCEDCGHLEDRCECPHDCTYPENTHD